MKFNSLEIRAFLGTKHLLLEDLQPMVAIFGPNESGKSTIGQAMRFLHQGDPGRVDKKKDYVDLVTDGHKAGAIEAVVDGHKVKRTIKDGLFHGGTPPVQDLPYFIMFGGAEFSKLSANAKRVALIQCAGVDNAPEEVAKEMERRGVAKEAIKGLELALKTGMDEAFKEATAQARLGKAEWKSITGETWGPDKGEDWTPTVDPDEQRKRENDVGDVAEMRKQAAALEAERSQRNRDYLQAKKVYEGILFPRRHAEGYTCPHCYEPVRFDHEENALVKAGEIRTLCSAEDEKKAHKAMENAHVALLDAETGLRELGVAIEVAVRSKQWLEDMSSPQDDLIKQAAAVHERILDWQSAAVLCGPTGLELEWSQSAINRINQLMAAWCVFCGWPSVQINPAMGVTWGGRAIRLCAESAEWRANAMIAAAMAVESKVRLVVLDRCDILEKRHRGALFRWVAEMTGDPKQGGRLDQVFLMATTDTPPKMPSGVQTVWLGG